MIGLFAEGEKTRLKLTHEGLETFPQNNPDFAQNSFAQGWTHIIGTSLPDFLSNKEMGPSCRRPHFRITMI